MRRSKLLASVALLLALALAGCSAPGSLTMEEATDAKIGNEATHAVPDQDRQERYDADERAIRGAIENGSTTVEATSPPVREVGPWGHTSGVYNLSWETVDSHQETRVDVRVDYDPNDTSGKAISWADLPEVDRERFGVLVERTARESDGYDFGTHARYDDAEAERSAFVGDQEYEILVYDGERYRIDVETDQVTVETYRYTAEKVAPSVEDYGAQLREEYAFELADLSDAERSVVQKAINDTYYPDGDDDQAFQGIVDTLRNHEAVTEDEYHGEWIVRYDGTVYWVDARYPEYN